MTKYPNGLNHYFSTMQSAPTNAFVKIAAMIVIFAAIMYAQTLVNSILLAVFISIICVKPVVWLKSKKIPHGPAITIVMIGLTFAFLAFGQLINMSFSSFLADVPKYEEEIQFKLKYSASYLQHLGLPITFDSMIQLLDPSKVMSITASAFSELGKALTNSLTIFFLVLFMLIEFEVIPKKMYHIVPSYGKEREQLLSMGQSIRRYLVIKTIVSLISAVWIYLTLLIIGVDHPVIWAVITFLLNFIPNIGSIVAAIPPILFSLFQLGPVGMMWTSITFIVMNLVMGNIIEPKMMGKGLGLSVLIIFVSLLFWGLLLGVTGMFLAIPISITLMIAFDHNENTKWIAVLMGTGKDLNDQTTTYTEDESN